MARAALLVLSLASAVGLGCARQSASAGEDLRARAMSGAPPPDPVAVHEYRFERAGKPVRECVRADQLLAAPELAESWPLAVRRSERAARTSGEPWPRDRLFFFGRGELRGRLSRTARSGDGLHFFYTHQAPSACEVRYVDVAREAALLLDAMPSLSGKVGVHFGAFDVAAFGGRLLVVYGTPSDAYGSPSELRRIWLTPHEERVEASAPEMIFLGKRRVFDVQLVASDDRVDLIWQLGTRLSYSSLRDPDGAWSSETVLTESANPGSASLVSDGDLVCIVWSDARYEEMRGLAPINGRKLMLRSSTDGGRTFGPVLLIDDPEDEEQATLLTHVALAGARPVLFGRDEGEETWRHLLLARDVRAYWELPRLSTREIEEAYEARMRPLFER